MHILGRVGKLCGTSEQLCRLARCSPAEIVHALAELQTTEAADVTLRNDVYTIINRRMFRECRQREMNALRQKRFRSNAENNGSVTGQKSEIRDQKSERNKANAPPNPEHKAFIDGWCQNFRAVHGFDYCFAGGKDGKAVSELLKLGILRLDLLEIAKQAWTRHKTDLKAWGCSKSITIAGFKTYLNEIRTELKINGFVHKSIGPGVDEVAESIRQKIGDVQVASRASAFVEYWGKRFWKKNGRPVEWNEELAVMCGKWKEEK